MAVTYDDIFNRYGQDEINNVTVDVDYRLQTSGYLEQFHRYKITKSGAGTNFIPVGAADNNVGTWFNAITSTILPTWTNGELQAGRSQIDVVEEYLDKARVDLAGYAEQAGYGVDETNDFQRGFLICQTMALLCEKRGLTEKANLLRADALKLLYVIWGQIVYNSGQVAQDTATVILKPYATITKADYTDFDASLGW